MIYITIDLFGSIRYAAGTKRIEIEYPPGRTVYELLRFVADTYGKELEEELFLPDGNSLREDLTIIINGMTTERIKVLSKTIDESTIIALLPVFPGGG